MSKRTYTPSLSDNNGIPLEVDANDRRIKFVRIPQHYVTQLQLKRERFIHLSVMNALGISDNTWRKIRKGEQLRRYVAERLISGIQSTD